MQPDPSPSSTGPEITPLVLKSLADMRGAGTAGRWLDAQGHLREGARADWRVSGGFSMRIRVDEDQENVAGDIVEEWLREEEYLSAVSAEVELSLEITEELEIWNGRIRFAADFGMVVTAASAAEARETALTELREVLGTSPDGWTQDVSWSWDQDVSWFWDAPSRIRVDSVVLVAPAPVAMPEDLWGGCDSAP